MNKLEAGPQKPWFEIGTKAIDDAREELIDIALNLHDHPELNYQEHFAAKLLSDTLERHGFAVERGVGGIDTAFQATLEGDSGRATTVCLTKTSRTVSTFTESFR